MRIFFWKEVVDKIETYFVLNNFFGISHYLSDGVTNMVEAGTPQMTKWRIRFARCIPKATDIKSKYVTLTVFPFAAMVTRTRLSVTL